MAKRMLVDAAHPEETRVVVLSGHRLEEFDFETSTKKQIKGNIYLAKITRVEPSLQAAFVEYGGNRHGFLAFNEIHPDYYRIPVSDRRGQGRDGPSRLDAGEESHEHEHPDPPDHAADVEEHRHEPFAESNVEHENDVHDAHDAHDALNDAALHADAHAEPDRPAEVEDAQASRAESGYGDVRYETRDAGEERHGEDAHEAAGDHPPASEQRAMGDHDQDDHPHDRPEHDDHPEQGATGEAGVEEGRPDADIIETVGGDELEDTSRQRTRPSRHYKIQEVIKRRQILLVQVTKEERGNKGAALTTFLSLAGRYCVLMPNTPRGGGVSRKITSATDRRRLKDLMSDLDVPDGMGVIVRTAGSERSKPEIKRDFEYLLRLWDDIRDLTLKSTAPALIYEEGNLIKRSIRDLYTRDLEDVIVDGEEGYKTAKAFMKMLMPSHAKRIKLYHDPSVPLFHRYQVDGQIDAIHSPVVQLRSGGYIVINPTEALVAIDVNSGRSTKERNIEETAFKTNLEAAEEIARQLRLRDLAGLIVIDFIDMEEHRNQASVERKLKEAMRYDRARIQLGRISPFGLLELSRQRLRPSLLEASTQPCPHCNGSGHIRSTESTALHVLRAIEEEGMRRRSAEISVAVPTVVALYILNHKRDTLVHTEARYGFRVTIGSDDTLIPPAFRLERLRALTPTEIAALPAPVVVVAEPEPEEEEDEQFAEENASEAPATPPVAEESSAEDGREPAATEEGHGRRRRRRRRRGWRGEEGRDGAAAAPSSAAEVAPATDAALENNTATAEHEDDAEETGVSVGSEQPAGGPAHAEHGDQGSGRKRRRRGRRGGRRRRRGEPGADGMPMTGDHAHEEHGAPPSADAPVIAEAVEYVPQTPMPDAAKEITEAFRTAPAPSIHESGAESVPVSERGDYPSMDPPPPSTRAPAPVSTTSPASGDSPKPSAQEDAGRPQNPKRGWWRRVIDP